MWCSRLRHDSLCCEQVLFLAASVRLSVRINLENYWNENWCSSVGICPKVNARSGWKLMIFVLDRWSWELFTYLFSFQVIYFEWLGLAASFSVWRYIRISKSQSSFKVMWVNHKVTVAKQRQRAGLCSPQTQFNFTWSGFVFVKRV